MNSHPTFRGGAIGVLSLLGIAGCSSIPDQEQLTEIDSIGLVRRIMCETKFELLNDPILKNKDEFVMALRFDFETTNQKSKDGDVKFTFPVGLGTVSFGLDKGAITDKYFGEENITVSNTFPEYRALPCENLDVAHLEKSENGNSYPITGKIEIGTTIRRYFELQQFSKAAKIDPYSRTLRFIAIIKGGLKTTIELSYAGGKRINASNTLSAERIDQHEVLVIIKPIPPEKSKEQKIASRTYYVVQIPPKIVEGTLPPGVTGAPPLLQVPDFRIPEEPSPSDITKGRANRGAEQKFQLDILKEIERRLQSPPLE